MNCFAPGITREHASSTLVVVLGAFYRVTENVILKTIPQCSSIVLMGTKWSWCVACSVFASIACLPGIQMPTVFKDPVCAHCTDETKNMNMLYGFEGETKKLLIEIRFQNKLSNGLFPFT